MIIFKKLRYKNFLSTGDEFTEVNLNSHPTTLFSGTNGKGKSTFIDALTFVLYGVPFRNINIPLLVNDTNERDLIVEVEFSISKTNYMIRRGLKPRIFEVYRNRKLIDQDAKSKDYQKYLEQNILKISKKSFTQVVVLGSANFIPFMRLVAAERRALIEDILDIQIFSAMNLVLKSRLVEMKDQYEEYTRYIEIQGQKIELVQQYLKKLKADNAASILEKRQTIEENKTQKNETLAEIALIRAEISNLTESIKEQAKLKQKVKKLESAEDNLANAKIKATKEENFFKDNETCPTCKQDIDGNFKSLILWEKQKLIVEIEEAMEKLKKDLEESETELAIIAKTMRVIGEKENKISKLTSAIHAVDTFISKIQTEIDNLQIKGDDSDEYETKLLLLNNELKSYHTERDNLIQRKHYLDIVSVMLKDNGIKTKIIKQYLPIINKYVNKYFAEMDFFATFRLDETFKETIHIRGSKERVYLQLSEGQKLRIDLALLFTWREVAKLKNSADTNLLIMDEIFEKSLDPDGVDDLLRLIQTLGKSTNVFVISPQADGLVDKFANTIKFVELQGFSVMEKI